MVDDESSEDDRILPPRRGRSRIVEEKDEEIIPKSASKAVPS